MKNIFGYAKKLKPLPQSRVGCRFLCEKKKVEPLKLTIMKKSKKPQAKKNGKSTKCYEHSKEWTVYVEGIGNVKCRRMCSKDERETINYLLQQPGANLSGRCF